MNIRDLQYLVAVHDLKNFSKAAERCFVSQPTLSGQLKKMEQELGAELIERSTRKVLFTELGLEVVKHSREALLSIEKIRDSVQQHADPMEGDFHLGLIPTVGPFLLPIIMPELSRIYPQATMFLYELRTEELIEKLLGGDLDAAILAKLDWEHPVTQTELYSEPMQLAVSALEQGLAQKERVDLSVLDDRRVLMLEDGHCLRDQAIDVCFSAGAKEDQRFKATSMDTLLHMVATGAGMTLIPELATRNKVQGVRFVRFAKPIPKRDIVMLTRRKSAREIAIKNLADVIVQSVRRADVECSG